MFESGVVLVKVLVKLICTWRTVAVERSWYRTYTAADIAEL